MTQLIGKLKSFFLEDKLFGMFAAGMVIYLAVLIYLWLKIMW